MLKVLALQIGTGAALGAVVWSAWGWVAGYSALLGGLACVIPNAFLAMRLAAPRGDAGARALIRAAYAGELGKLALTVLIFGGVFMAVRPIAAAPLFAGFIATQLVALAGLWMRSGQQRAGQTSRNNGD